VRRVKGAWCTNPEVQAARLIRLGCLSEGVSGEMGPCGFLKVCLAFWDMINMEGAKSQ